MTSFIKKTILGSLITIGSLVGFVFAFGSADPLEHEIAKEPTIPRFETIPQSSAVLSKANITEEVAKQIAQELIEKNPEGPNGGAQIGLATIDPQTLAQDAIARAFKEVKIDDLRPVVKLTDLTIIKSTEKAFAEQYFRKINDIIGKNFPESVAVNWDDPVNTNFGALINAYSISMSESMQVAVPEGLAELHRRYVSLLGAEKNALTIVKNYLVDPAQATVAIEAGNTFSDELMSVLGQMDDYIVEHKLNLTA